jgi:DNA-binding IclR family transcriptional regulator
MRQPDRRKSLTIVHGRSTVPAARAATEGAQSIKRAFMVMRIVVAHGEAGATLKSVATASGLHRATAHRILSALVDEGALEFDPATFRYRLGVEIFSFSAAMGERFDIRSLARPAVEELSRKTRDTVYLGVRSGYDGLCIDMCEGNYPVKTLRVHVRDRWPLGIGAFTMPLLAYLPDAEVADIIRHNAHRLADQKDHTPDLLRKEVEETRKRGFAVNYIMAYPGMCGIGVPILDQHGHPLASLCVVAVIRRMDPKRQALIAQTLWTKSRQIAERWRSVREIKGPLEECGNGNAMAQKGRLSA